MIQALIFDFGNVVGFFDHHRVTSRLASHGTLAAASLHSLIFGGTLEDDYETGRITSAQFLSRIRALGNLHCSDEVLMECYADIFWPNPDVAALLPLLKPNYRLILASNTSELHSRQFRRQFAETLAHFDAQVLSHEIGARKPSPAFYEYCLERANCPAAACVFIDDLASNVAGARASGLRGIVYAGFDNLRREFAQLGITLP
jgi:HAD superfamily hydrolase (TIGR01509 family)